MKKLLVLTVAATAALTGCSKASSVFHTKVDDNTQIITIGNQEFSKQNVYQLLKETDGATYVRNWFKKAIVEDLYSNADQIILARANYLLDLEKIRLAPTTNYLEQLNRQGYVDEADYIERKLKADAVNELFNEHYVNDESRKEELFDDYQPRNIWQIKSNSMDNAYDLAEAAMTNFADAAVYRYDVMFDYTIEDASDRENYTYNTDATYGIQGLVHDTYQTNPTIAEGEESYLGWIGYTLNNSSRLTEKIRKELFDDELTTCTAEIQEKEDYSCLNDAGLLEINGSKYHNESSTSYYVVKAEIITHNDTTIANEMAAREIAKVSTIQTKAQTELFKLYNLKAWDEVIYDAISATILDNKN